jgi:Putative MetA-pathway of phenol degradation
MNKYIKAHLTWAGRYSACAMLMALCALPGSAVADDEAPTATPYRPTVSNPADLSLPGHFEIESGVQRVLGDDDTRQDSLPYLVKYAFSENVGVLIGGNAYLRQADPLGHSASGFGDTFVELKLRHALNDDSAIGLELGPLLPSARDGLGEAQVGWLLNTIYSRDIGDYHVDLNIGANRSGDRIASVSRWQVPWAGAISRPINEQWGASLEFSGVRQRGAATTSQALAAINYNVSHSVVLDAGMAYGLTHAAHDRSLFAGATVALGALN